MENRAYAIGTGVFMLLLLALLIVGALWLGGGTFNGTPYDLISDTSVAGLGRGASVRLRGVDVGKVDAIGFDPQDPRRVRVRVALDPEVRLMQGAFATLSYLGVSGAAYVELDYPSGSSQVLATSAGVPTRLPLRPSWLSQLTDSAEGFLKTFTGTLQRADVMLNQQNAEHLSRLLVQLDAAAVQVTAVASDLRPAAKRVDALLADADLAVRSTGPVLRNFDGLVADVRARVGVLDAVRDGANDVGQAARGVERTLVRDTLPRVDRLAQQLSRDADTLDQLLRVLKDQPQSMIFGLAPTPPGPGEPGFQPPRSARR